MLKLFLMLIIVSNVVLSDQQKPENIKTMIFEEQRIEGKIRRPQLVLIKADQRPQFSPMALQSMGKGADITKVVSEDILSSSPYKKPFQFKGTKIINLVK